MHSSPKYNYSSTCSQTRNSLLLYKDQANQMGWTAPKTIQVKVIQRVGNQGRAVGTARGLASIHLGSVER